MCLRNLRTSPYFTYQLKFYIHTYYTRYELFELLFWETVNVRLGIFANFPQIVYSTVKLGNKELFGRPKIVP
jgi:hypothetical protein